MNTETAMRVTTYDLAPQLVLCISKRVKIDGLEEHIRETPKRLIAFRRRTAFGGDYGPGVRNLPRPGEPRRRRPDGSVSAGQGGVHTLR